MSEGGRSTRPKKPKRKRKSLVPRWARWCTVFGAVLMVLSGGVLVSYEALLARYEGAVGEGDLFGDQAAGAQQKKTDIKGPLNILLVGIDPRTPTAVPLADSMMILHVNQTLDQAYLFSMPRDLRVDIPRFEKANYGGGNDRLNAAMSHGSRIPGKNPDPAAGFELLSKTISRATGIKRFDAGAIINFGGFEKIVDAMGGVDMYIDTSVKSEHKRPDGTARQLKRGGGGYLGPQAEYKKGRAHLKGWQALDYVRQRKTLPNGDYDRQRHQQQFVRAMADQALSKNVAANPIKLDSVLRAAGKALIFNGRGHSVADFGFALRGLGSDGIQMIKLPGRAAQDSRGKYAGEQFLPVADEFFEALGAGEVDSFVLGHPELLNNLK